MKTVARSKNTPARHGLLSAEALRRAAAGRRGEFDFCTAGVIGLNQAETGHDFENTSGADRGWPSPTFGQGG